MDKHKLVLALASLADELESHGALDISSLVDSASGELSDEVIYSKLPFDSLVESNYNTLLKFSSTNMDSVHDRAHAAAHRVIQFVRITLADVDSANSLVSAADNLALLESLASISSEWSE